MKPELFLKINGFVSKYEYSLLGSLIAALLIYQFSSFEFRGIVLIVLSSTLAMAYAISAFGDVHNMQVIEKPGVGSKWLFLIPFSKKLVAIASALSCMAIIFTTLQWPGGIDQLISGTGTLLVCIITFLYLRNKNEDLIPQTLVVRAIVLVSLQVYAWYFTHS